MDVTVRLTTEAITVMMEIPITRMEIPITRLTTAVSTYASVPASSANGSAAAIAVARPMIQE